MPEPRAHVSALERALSHRSDTCRAGVEGSEPVLVARLLLSWDTAEDNMMMSKIGKSKPILPAVNTAAGAAVEAKPETQTSRFPWAKDQLERIPRAGIHRLLGGSLSVGFGGFDVASGFSLDRDRGDGRWLETSRAIGRAGLGAAGAIVGQVMIPIPILGAVIGGALGSAAGESVGSAERPAAPLSSIVGA